MRKAERIDKTMDLMKELWKREELQDLRFWQLVKILEATAQHLYSVTDVWNLEEEEWNKVIQKMIEQ